jgi:hypothetical protein
MTYHMRYSLSMMLNPVMTWPARLYLNGVLWQKQSGGLALRPSMLSRSWLITWVVTRVTRRAPLMDQELLLVHEHLRSPPDFSGFCVARFLLFWVMFLSKINLFLSFYIPILYRSHQKSLIIDVYCRTSAMARVSVISGSLNTDVTFVLIDLLSFLIRIWIYDLTALTHSESLSNSSFLVFHPFFGIVLQVILHIQLLYYQKRNSLIIICRSCLLLVYPWKMRSVISPYCIGYHNYTIVHTSNVISRGLPSVLPYFYWQWNVLILLQTYWDLELKVFSKCCEFLIFTFD